MGVIIGGGVVVVLLVITTSRSGSVGRRASGGNLLLLGRGLARSEFVRRRLAQTAERKRVGRVACDLAVGAVGGEPGVFLYVASVIRDSPGMCLLAAALTEKGAGGPYMYTDATD